MGKNIELEQLVINKLTQAQYDALTVKNPGELYFITDANPTKEVEAQLAELSEKVPEPISTYESFPEATAENVGMRVVYTGETIEAPSIENEDGSVSTVFLDPYLTRGHTFMLVPVKVLTSDTESITIYMWQDVIGAIPPFDYNMAGQVLSTNGMGYEWTELPEAGVTKEEADQTYLPLSGGTMTGGITFTASGAGINAAPAILDQHGNVLVRVGDYGSLILGRSSQYVDLLSSLKPSGSGIFLGDSTGIFDGVYTRAISSSNYDNRLLVPAEGGTLARLEDIPESTQVETIPEVSVDNVGKVLQYIGQTNETYTNGYFYKCLIDASNAFQLNTDNMWLPEHTISIVNANQLRKAISNEYLAKENSILFYYDIFDGVPAWACDLGNYGFFGPLTDDEMLNNYGISIVKTGDTDAQPGDYFSITYIAENEINGWQQIDVQPEADALPDQTGNAGKFLMTDGTTASWGEALVNNATSITAVAIGVDTIVKDYGVAIGYSSGVTKAYISGVAIGCGQRVAADGATQIGCGASWASTVINSDVNTFKVSNKNGNFEMMDAQGNIPLDRLTYVTDQIGDISAVLDSINGETLEG